MKYEHDDKPSWSQMMISPSSYSKQYHQARDTWATRPARLSHPSIMCMLFCRMCVSRVTVATSSLDTAFWPCSSAFGTHLDGLGHAVKDGYFYNGIPISEEIETVYDVNNAFFSKENNYEPPLEQQNRTVVHQQLRTLGLDNVPPIATRGIVLNMLEVYGDDEKVKTATGEEHLPAGFIITPEKVQEALELQGLIIEKGDVVLFHTGWEQALWLKDQAQYDIGTPGIGLEAAQYLICHQILAAGADTWCVMILKTHLLPPVASADSSRRAIRTCRVLHTNEPSGKMR